MLRLFLAIIIAFGFALHAYASAIEDRIAAMAPSGAIFVVSPDGETLVAHNSERRFVPASVAKLVTAWMAFETLGTDYRFETRFYVDDDGMLYVRGGGDPFLVSEELALIAPELIKRSGRDAFAGIRVDRSYFPDRLTIPGIVENGRTYNAPNGALAVNFNTINAVRDGNSVRSGEEQTPITPLAISQFRERGPNGRGRISLSQGDPDLGALYAGELLAEFIKREGLSIDGDIAVGRVPDALEPLYVHRQTRPLEELARLMLLGSNNYLANQIFLEVGVKTFGSPASLEKSQKVLGDLLGARDLSDGITMVEGSGISRANSMTQQGIIALLDDFEPHMALMTKSKAGSRYKTGTLDDVSTLAGYVQTQNHGMSRFVIVLPGGTGQLRFNILNALEAGL